MSVRRSFSLPFLGASTVVVLSLSSPLVMAQQQSPPADTAQFQQEQNKMLETQMDNYLNQLVRAAAQVQVLTTENAALQKKLADAEKKSDAKAPPPAPEPPK